jgi:putative ABC transport system permease protein
VLPLLGVAPVLGRGFTEADGVLGNNQLLIISSGLWQRQFGGSPDVIGRRVLVEGAPFTIIGVMPPDFHFPSRAVEYWQPYAFDKSNTGYFWAVEDKRFLARTAPGVSLAQAQREVREVWPTLRTLNPLWDPGPEYRRDASPVPLQTDVVGSSGRLLWILFGCVLLVLLICCVNVANLLLARATARERELVVRAALGGGRGRLIRQLITESLLLSGIGSAAGIALAYISVQWLVPALSASIPRAHEISVNGTVLAFTALVAVLTGVLFGLIPALRATRAVGHGPAAGGTRTSHGAAHHRVSAVLVSGEVALAVLLVIGATLLMRSLNALMHTEPGFETAHVIAARLSPPEGTYKTAEQVAALYTSVLDRASGLPGVRSVAAVDRLSLAQNIWGMAPRVEGLFEDAKHSLPDIGHFQAVTADYFSTLGIPLRAGRTFTEADRADAPPVAIVSESFARKFWPKGDAVGRRVGYPWESPWITIVGIVADTRQDSLRDTSRTSMYVPWRQRSRMSGSEMWVLARTTGDPAALASSLRAIVRETDRTVAVSDVRTLDAVLVASVQKSRFTVLAVGAFALAALLLGAIGIYGVMSYLVGERAREMGIRIALGAPLSGVISLVVGRAAKLAAAGAVIGVGAALLSMRLLNSFLVGVSATDPLTFVLVPLLFICVALAASAAPARRAARADPASTLRAD